MLPITFLKASKMNYQTDDLKAPDFVLMDTLRHDDLLVFIKKAYEQKNISYYIYNFLAVVFLGILVGLMCKEFVKGEFRFSTEFTYFSYGLLSTFLLIPLHEYIHVLAYKYVGAKNTSYDMNLKKFYFMAMADKFVANAKQFKIVALAPFVVISSMCLISIFFVSGYWIYFSIGIFFTHSLFCSGDFGLVNYFETHADKEVYTYDDKAAGISYFYEKVST